MTKKIFAAFTAARDRYRKEVRALERKLPELGKLQQELVNKRSGPAYTVETPLVYNRALDDVGPAGEIRLILVADNPGRREQAAENRRYLVGPSGKIAEKFFRDHPELGMDFRKNVIILNKTPVHTPRTAELKELSRLYSGGKSEAFARAIDASQRAMAELLLEFQRAFSSDKALPVWITGYSEMKAGGSFEAYTERLRTLYGQSGIPGESLKNALFLYRHFSMNQFTIDLKQQANRGESMEKALKRIGEAFRLRILEW
jgi:hypothetical protein